MKKFFIIAGLLILVLLIQVVLNAAMNENLQAKKGRSVWTQDNRKTEVFESFVPMLMPSGQ